jgi:hypothetical protein
LTKLEAAQDAMTPPRADAMAALARAHIGRHRAADALPLLEQADAFWRSFAPDSSWARDTARQLAACRASVPFRK